MSGVRARIAEALREHGTSAIPTWANERICLCDETFRSMPPGPDLADHVADVLLSLPGIAIVELPEGHDVGPPGERYLQFKNVVAGPYGEIRDESTVDPVKHNPTTARRHAASLLAAANAAEAGN